MTIREALKQRIPRVRKPVWGNKNAYLRLPLFAGGEHGPWSELYDDVTQQDVLGERPGSQRLCVLLDFGDDDGYERYDGPVSPFEQDSKNFARAYVEN